MIDFMEINIKKTQTNHGIITVVNQFLNTDFRRNQEIFFWILGKNSQIWQTLY